MKVFLQVEYSCVWIKCSYASFPHRSLLIHRASIESYFAFAWRLRTSKKRLGRTRVVVNNNDILKNRITLIHMYKFHTHIMCRLFQTYIIGSIGYLPLKYGRLSLLRVFALNIKVRFRISSYETGIYKIFKS